MNAAGMTTKTTSPAYGLTSQPRSTAISSATNSAADVVVRSAPMIANGCRASTREPVVTALYFRLCMYATRASMSAAGNLLYRSGMGGFFCEFVFVAISFGFTIH